MERVFVVIGAHLDGTLRDDRARVDTGVDDTYALMLAVRSPRLDLRAVTCVSGNTSVDNVVRNTAYVLDVSGAPEVPTRRADLRCRPGAGAPWRCVAAAPAARRGGAPGVRTRE